MQGTRLPAGGLPPSSSRGLSGAWFGHHFPTLCRVVILTTISVTHGFFFFGTTLTACPPVGTHGGQGVASVCRAIEERHPWLLGYPSVATKKRQTLLRISFRGRRGRGEMLGSARANACWRWLLPLHVAVVSDFFMRGQFVSSASPPILHDSPRGSAHLVPPWSSSSSLDLNSPRLWSVLLGNPGGSAFCGADIVGTRVSASLVG